MASIPIRNVVLTVDTGGANALSNIMSAVWADIGANSTWTQVHETNVTNAGDTSFAIQSPDATLQLNIFNSGVGNAFLGINPDGAVNSITNSASPHTGVPNFSGTDGGANRGALSASVLTKIILIEWSDAIMILGRESPIECSGAYFWGKIWLQPITGLESTTGGTRLDGHAIAPVVCARAAFGGWWGTGPIASFRRRCSVGQTNETTTTISPVTAWAEHNFGFDPGATADAAFQYSGQRLVLPLMSYCTDTSAADAYIWKYVRIVGEQLPIWSTYTIDGVGTYMTLNKDNPNASCNIAVPIIDGFDPFP